MAVFSTPRAMAGTLQLPYPSAEMWRKRIADQGPEDYMLVAEVKGEVVGNLGLHPAGARGAAMPPVSACRCATTCKGKVWARALLRAAIDIADHWLNYRRLELTVYADNIAAVALYRKFGFVIEGTLVAYAYRDGRYVDAYTMARLRCRRRPPASGTTQARATHAAQGHKTTRKRTAP